VKRTLITLILLLSLSSSPACAFTDALPFLEAPPDQSQKECDESSEPTEEDVEDILSFSKKTFDAPGWERSYTVMPNRVAVTWLHNEIGAVAYFANLLYACGGAYDQINEYLSKDSFAISLKDYDSYKETASCQTGNIRLHQFDVINQELPYQVRYWAEPQSDTRAYITMLVFPTGSPKMDEYAISLYPQLTLCR